MKRQHSTLVSIVESAVTQLRRAAALSLGGEPLSSHNALVYSRCVELWLYTSEDLMLRQGLNEQSRRQRLTNMVSVILAADVRLVLTTLSSISEFLLTDGDFDGFKHLDLPLPWREVWLLLSPISLLVPRFFVEPEVQGKAHLLRCLFQFLKFPKKLDFEAIGLEEQALCEYCRNEEKIGAVVFDDFPELDQLAEIIKGWFGGFHIENLRPMHGPGSVAQGPLTLAQKYDNLETDSLIDEVLRYSYSASSSEFMPGCDRRGRLVRRSRTIFVPKTATKLRTISMEPVTLQYIQQGVMRELYRYIGRHPYLGLRIVLDDQTQNQVLALEGSMMGTYSTIDLSAASDSVAWDLVRRLFSKVPSLMKWLLITRSRESLLPNGEVIQLKKYAPMGSALCFPIECIIFAAITELATRRDPTRCKPAPQIYSVYGDDIVLPTSAYDTCVELLRRCGFTVNKEKSFSQGPYRESCGKEYYGGLDISSLYYRTPFFVGRPSPSAISNWCSMANLAYYHRLPTLRSALITKVLSSSRLPPYFTVTPEASPQLYSPTPTNYRSIATWNKAYQREEGRFLTVKSRQRDAELDDDDIRYHHTLLLMSWREPHYQALEEQRVAWGGTVEFFSSSRLPILPYLKRDLRLAQDWS